MYRPADSSNGSPRAGFFVEIRLYLWRMPEIINATLNEFENIENVVSTFLKAQTSLNSSLMELRSKYVDYDCIPFAIRIESSSSMFINLLTRARFDCIILSLTISLKFNEENWFLIDYGAVRSYERLYRSRKRKNACSLILIQRSPFDSPYWNRYCIARVQYCK